MVAEFCRDTRGRREKLRSLVRSRVPARLGKLCVSLPLSVLDTFVHPYLTTAVQVARQGDYIMCRPQQELGGSFSLELMFCVFCPR